MARTKTLLDGVNRVLIRVGQIDSQRKLTSLVSAADQRYVDNAVDLWNDAIQDLYTLTSIPMPVEAKETQITLVVGVGEDGKGIEGLDEYDLPSDLVQIRWPIEDRINGLRIYEYPGGFEQMRADRRIQEMWTGLPIRACISPINFKLKMDRFCDAGNAGRVYTLTYDRSILMENAADLMPFEDDVFTAMVPLIATLWENKQTGASTDLGRVAYGKAARLLSGLQMRDVY